MQRSAKRLIRPMKMQWLKGRTRGQTERRPVRSHKIQFLQWVAGCLIRGGLPMMTITRFS